LIKKQMEEKAQKEKEATEKAKELEERLGK
jgi:hypothetical protein